ncbi:unnamed protein product [Rhizoctonia solani]|uniref:Oxidation resistance protein 1 n=1 Tax=Rhizoctonia solani TaxID=456999 RepID=A0A8H2XV54_9AGAM|nr:unnamed protein product [Rhizoctonia solani]
MYWFLMRILLLLPHQPALLQCSGSLVALPFLEVGPLYWVKLYLELSIHPPLTLQSILLMQNPFLRQHLPALRRLAPKWSLLYSLDQHGISLATFYARCEQPSTGGCLVAIRDSEGATFGVWCGDGIRKHEGYAGTGESNGKFGLYLDSALLDGESASCPTFDNEPLCSGGSALSTGTVKYECVGMEAWSII